MPEPSANLRLLVPLPGGRAVEAVHYQSGTLCVSCQAGCAVGCAFCASGSRGWFANLTAEEMAMQLEAARGEGGAPSRVTVSGIGEPLHNFFEVKRFMALCKGDGLAVSLTTTGGPPGRLAEALALDHNGIMLSLHAGREETRRRLIPGAPGLNRLWGVLASCWPNLSRRRRRKVGINYLVLSGVNDSRGELEALIRGMEPFPEMTLHLLTLNSVPGTPFVAPEFDKVLAIRDYLGTRIPHVRLANRWRRQAEGGCGTLFVRSHDHSLSPGEVLPL